MRLGKRTSLIKGAHRDMRPVVPGLRLTHAVYFFDIVEHLLQGRAVCHRLQDLRHACFDIGTEVRSPTVIIFLYQYHANQPTRWLVGRQESLVPLGYLDAIEHKRAALPTASVSRTLGQADRLLAVDPWPARSRPFGRHRHIEQGRVLAQATD